MAGFEGVKWASHQMQYILGEKAFSLLAADAGVSAVTRTIHYGQFMAFEGIRFFCKRDESGKVMANFLNWDKNLKRFQRGISFNLSRKQQGLVPDLDEMIHVFIQKYFKNPSMRPFFEEMADLGAQGYLRPFTVDEEQSIGVTFPGRPSIRAVVCRYDRYLGEPFGGVVVPNMVRAVGANRTGCLKLGINYLMSVKALDAAREIDPDAASALFLDDRPEAPLNERLVTEWDSSCCLFALKDGSVIKIPESPLILPSVTIQGITAILRRMGVSVHERDISYGELLSLVKNKELVAVCSIGTAGILNRCHHLRLVDGDGATLAVHRPDESHDLFARLSAARAYYWDIYREREDLPDGMRLETYPL